MASVTGVSNYYNEQTLVVDGLQYNANTYTKLRIFNYELGTYRDVNFGASTTSAQAVFTGLSPNTAYNYYAESTWGGGDRRIPSSGFVRYTTPSEPANYQPATPSISATVSGLTATVKVVTGINTTGIIIDRNWMAGDFDYTSNQGAYSTVNYTFDLPSYGTTYGVRVKAENAQSGDSSVFTSYVYFTTASSVGPIVIPVFTANSPQGALTSTHWNGITSKINQLRTSKSLATVSFPIAQSGSILYADNFNQAINALNAMNPPITAPQLVTNQTVGLSSRINRLVDSINSLT